MRRQAQVRLKDRSRVVGIGIVGAGIMERGK